MIGTSSMSLLEAAINRYLSLDPEMSARLAPFEGKVIAVDISGLDKVFYLVPEQGGMKLTQTIEGEADTTLKGPPTALFQMGLSANVAPMMLKGDIEIIGDVRLGREFKQVLADIDIDWEEQLSVLLGDTGAHQLMKLTRNVTDWGRRAVDSMVKDVSEYLQEESRDVVSGAELEVFYQDVDRLRDDVDRLEARVQAMQKAATRDK